MSDRCIHIFRCLRLIQHTGRSCATSEAGAAPIALSACFLFSALAIDLFFTDIPVEQALFLPVYHHHIIKICRAAALRLTTISACFQTPENREK